jgi:hypothetical protein
MRERRGRANLVDTPEMATLFDRLDHLNQEQLLALHAAWKATSREEHEDAWATVRAVGVRYDLSKEIERVREKAMAWATRGSDSVPYVRPNDTESWLQMKMEAGEAIVDAALAVALGDRLDEQTRATLLAAWDRAT